MKRVHSAAIGAGLFLFASAAQAVPMSVNYQLNSWVADGLTPLIATSLANSGVQTINAARRNTQTFVAPSNFTLDRIWISYESVQPVGVGTGPGTTIELRLFSVADANAPNLPAAPVNLFPETQTHVVPLTAPNNLGSNGGNFAIFDVHNLNLVAGNAYAFQLVANGFPYQWRNNGAASTYANGRYYRVDLDPDGQLWDQVFAIEAAPLVTAASFPEPAGAVLLMGGLAALNRRRGKHGAIEAGRP